MNYSRNSRREFLRKAACLACSGGAAALIPQLRMIGTALAVSPPPLTGYKALVCIYLAGGNDSWNLLIPHDTARYNVYSTARNGVFGSGNTNGLALANPAAGNSQIITDGNDSNGATNEYFMHPNLPNLANIYKSNKLAFAVNVGTLTAPIDMTDYNNTSSLRPPQLFSHADQTNLWNQANTNPASTLGWGGLCADDLQAQGANGTPISGGPQLSLCVSIAGANRFEIGNVVNNPYQMSSSGLTKLSGMCNPCSGGGSNASLRDSALTDLLADTYANDFAGEYANVFGNARELFSMLNPSLGIAPYNVGTFPTTSLGNQLKIVAEMIKLSKAQSYATRQIYFVQLGGFDMHSGLMSTQDPTNPPASDHAGLLKQLDDAVSAFWTEMGAQGIQNDVTAFTATEFARTLQSNGSGSDHGWGGVQMVLGGAVLGGALYSKGVSGDNGKNINGFPNQAYGSATNHNANAFSRGQLIPGISVDQYAGAMAKWLDVRSTSLSTVFPNLTNFPGGTLGFLPTT